MIKVQAHRLFEKDRGKLTHKQEMLLRQRLLLFQQNPRHPLLKTHCLRGIFRNFFAFWLEGDLRVIFQWIDKNTIRLYRVGTHNQVY